MIKTMEREYTLTLDELLEVKAALWLLLSHYEQLKERFHGERLAEKAEEDIELIKRINDKLTVK